MIDELEFEVFGITAELDIHVPSLWTQRQFCKQVLKLFAHPPWVAKYALQAIVSQLELGGYENEAGPLELSTAFIALKELAES